MDSSCYRYTHLNSSRNLSQETDLDRDDEDLWKCSLSRVGGAKNKKLYIMSVVVHINEFRRGIDSSCFVVNPVGYFKEKRKPIYKLWECKKLPYNIL